MTERRMRVAMVLDWFFFYAASVASALVEECDVMMVTRDHGFELGRQEDGQREKMRILDDRVSTVFIRGRQSQATSVVSALEARRALARFEPDVVHSQAHADWRLLLASGGARAAANVVTVHDVEPHPGSAVHSTRVHRAVQRALMRRADAFVVHGEFLRDRLREVEQVGSRDVFVIPHGILAQPAIPKPLPVEDTVLFFGRLEPYKGLDDFVEAVRAARRMVPGLRAVIAGRGSEAARLRASTSGEDAFRWEERFIPDEELPSLFGDAALVVLPYREASQSGVVPLAFASGRPVIATEVGALGEAVRHGETGLLVPPGDPTALARAMAGLLGDRQTLARMSEAALAETTEGRLSSAAIGRAHIAMYRTILDARGRG